MHFCYGPEGEHTKKLYSQFFYGVEHYSVVQEAMRDYRYEAIMRGHIILIIIGCYLWEIR